MKGLIAADHLPPRIFGAGTVSEAGRRKLAALDGIRGLAVLAVMFSHFNRFLPADPWLIPAKSIFAYGGSGVDLFFVLSGFLITGILLQTRTAVNYFRSFYARRVLRIFPLYYAALIAVFAASTILPSLPNVPPPGQRWLYFAYLCNWIPVWTGSWPPNVVGHFWSLAVEEQFYIVWPFCVFLLSRKALLRLAIGLCAFALLLRCYLVAQSGPTEAVMLGTFTRMDSLLFGAIAALMFAGDSGRRVLRYLTPIGASAALITAAGLSITSWGKGIAASFGFLTTIGYTLVAIACTALVLGAALGDGTHSPVQRIFRNAILCRVGKYSYGMYVYHVPLLGLCELVIWNHVPAPVRGNGLAASAYLIFLTALTFGVAALSYEFFERRILDAKRFFEPEFSPEDPIAAPES
jgi:peptidoglycan/LPS O-acetylase OafA/YrhL